MKIFVVAVVLVAFVAAEPPPSNSYLPPSPNAGAAGYPSGGPSIVAARSFNQGARGFGRNANQGFGGPKARFGVDSQTGFGQQGLLGRNGFEDEPAKYNFGYAVTDDYEGTDFGHHESRENQKAEGEYHVVLPDGRKQTVSYEADERGFKPRISYEDANGNGYNDNGPQNGGFGNARARGGY